MNKLKYFYGSICLLICLWWLPGAYAQVFPGNPFPSQDPIELNPYDFSNHSVPSPTTASLGQYINFPVVSKNGLIPISIPLESIKEQEIAIPISLNYHASGIKVDQEASWVGLGWSLSGGGVITRSVRGLPDDVFSRKTEQISMYQTLNDIPFVWRIGWIHPHSARKVCSTFPAVTVGETDYLRFLSFPRLPKVSFGVQTIQGTSAINPSTIQVSYGHNFYSDLFPLLDPGDITRRTNDSIAVVLQNIGPNFGIGYPSITPGSADLGSLPLDYATDPLGQGYVGLDSMDTRKSILDSEPDLFFVNAPGLSFKFVIGHDGLPKLYSNKDIEVTYFMSQIDATTHQPTGMLYDLEEIVNGNIPYEDWFGMNISKFVVTNDAGFTYTFDQLEMSKSWDTTFVVGPNGINDDSYISLYPEVVPTGWHLSKIETPMGREIHYTFSDVLETSTRYTYERHTPSLSQAGQPSISGIAYLEKSSKSTYSEVYTKQIESIESEHYLVKFFTSDRDDLQGSKRLDSISFFARTPSSHEPLVHIRSWDLITEYASSGMTLPTSNYCSCPDLKKVNDQIPAYVKARDLRLFLTEIVEQGHGSAQTSGKHYRLDYHNTKRISPSNASEIPLCTSLPSKKSFAQDYWGYPNGKGENDQEPSSNTFFNISLKTLTPKIFIYPNNAAPDRFRMEKINSPAYPDYFEIPGADRSIDIDYATSGTLASIQLPTGGYQSFDYESNVYIDPLDNTNKRAGGLRILKHRFQVGDLPDATQDIVKHYLYRDFDLNAVGSSGLLLFQPSFAREKAFSRWADAYTSGNYPTFSTNPSQWPNYLLATDNLDNLPLNLTEERAWRVFTEVYTQSITPLSDESGASVSYKYVEVIQEGAGKTLYEYYPERTFRSHATQVKSTEPTFYGQIRYLTNLIQFPNSLTSYATAIFPLGTATQPTQKVHWGAIPKEGENIFPYPPKREDFVVPYGMLKSEKHFAEGNHTQAIEETFYEYQAVFKGGTPSNPSSTIIRGLKYGDHQTLDNRITSNPNSGVNSGDIAPLSIRVTVPKAWATYEHHTEGGWEIKAVRKLTSSTEDVSQKFETKTEYFYESPFHNYMSRYEFQDNSIKLGYIKFYYPQDFWGNASGNVLDPQAVLDENTMGVKLLMDLQMLNQPLGIEQYRNNVLVGAQLQTYKPLSPQENIPVQHETWIAEHENVPNQIITNPSSTSPIPNQIQDVGGSNFVLEIDPIFEKRKVSEEYNTQADLTQERLVDGMTQTYVYGAIKHFPTAVVLNAQAAEVAYTSFEDREYGPVTNTTDINEDGGWEIVRTVANGWVDHDANLIQTGLLGFHIANRGSGNQERYVRKMNLPEGDYNVSFWYTGDPVHVIGTQPNSLQTTPTNSGGSMQYVTYTLNVAAGGTVEISCPTNAFIDELRIYPVGAQMTTYCFDKALRLHTQTDINNRSTYYHYDALGRLQYVQDQEGHYVQGYEYNYKN